MKHFFKSIVAASLVFSGASFANNDSDLFSRYTSASSSANEGQYNENAFEITIDSINKYGINSYYTGKTGSQISFVEGLLKTDYIFLGNVKSEDSNYNIETYEEILAHFEKRKNLEGAKIVYRKHKGHFNHLASAAIYEGTGYSMNDPEEIRPFKDFNHHSLVATALYSCDAELTEFLIKKGADNFSNGLPDTFAFFKTYNQFRRSTEPGEAVYNHHRVVTPFNNFMSCLSLNGYWKGNEWVNYPEGNPIQPYMEAFVKKMITHYLNKPELNLNEFGCYPVIKDYAYENFEWVRKMFTDKYGPDFAERCEQNYQAWEDSCKSIDLPNGGRAIKCSLRKY